MSRVKRLTQTVATMLSDDQLEKLTQITDELEISKSEFVRNVLVEKIEEYGGGTKDGE